MRRASIPVILVTAGLAGLATASLVDRASAACTGCTVSCQECVPACRGTWEEKKSTKPHYSMKCEYACTRGRDAWHAPSPGCRCHPPCGDVIVKKRFYKTDGPEKVERVPKYEVTMVPAEPCEPCVHCRDHGHEHHGACWNPLDFFRRCTSWW